MVQGKSSQSTVGCKRNNANCACLPGWVLKYSVLLLVLPSVHASDARIEGVDEFRSLLPVTSNGADSKKLERAAVLVKPLLSDGQVKMALLNNISLEASQILWAV